MENIMTAYQRHKKYRKIKSKRFFEQIKVIQWECVLSKTGSAEEIKKSYLLLKYFEGHFIRADGIICVLRELNITPLWSSILFDDGVQWSTLENYFNIYLPLKH